MICDNILYFLLISISEIVLKFHFSKVINLQVYHVINVINKEIH